LHTCEYMPSFKHFVSFNTYRQLPSNYIRGADPIFNFLVEISAKPRNQSAQSLSWHAVCYMTPPLPVTDTHTERGWKASLAMIGRT